MNNNNNNKECRGAKDGRCFIDHISSGDSEEFTRILKECADKCGSDVCHCITFSVAEAVISVMNRKINLMNDRDKDQ